MQAVPEIRPAATDADLASVAALFHAYAASLGIDLGFQGFAAEVGSLPGLYAPPGGILFLAWDRTGEAVGCVGLRPIAVEGCCEMKRLYVSPAGRGAGIGQALVAAVIAEASRIGYREIRLDTLPSMTGALALYRAAGFEPMPAYYATPVPGTIFLRRPLPGIA